MANIENIKVGNTNYGVRDKNTYRSLSAAQESTLLSTGKYEGEDVENNAIFQAEGGAVKKYNKTATGVTVNWTQGTLPVSEYWSAVAYGDGKYVAVAGGDYHSTSTAAYSTDGITWYSSSVPNKVWHTVTYGNGMFVAGNHYSGGSIIYSSDGINWTTATVPVAATWGVILFANNMFVALESGHYHSKGVYSTDGINWTSFNTPFSGQFTGLAYGNGKWVGVDAFNANKYIYSTTGTSWTDGTFSVSRERRIANNGNAFVALRVGTDKADYSTDGVTWTEVTLSRSCKRIVAGDGVFLAFDDSGNACTSTDGINWQNITQMPAQYGADCCYGDGKFVFVSGYSSKSTKAGSGTATISYAYTTTPLTYTKSETDTALAAKQGTLTAGTGVLLSNQGELQIAQESGDVTWEQPIVNSPGIMGVSEMAVDQSNYYTGDAGMDHRAFHCFNRPSGGTSTDYWQVNGISTSTYQWISWYTKTAVTITGLNMKNQSGELSIKECIFEGSNDNTNWTQLATGTNTNTQDFGEWYIDCSGNTSYYHYYRLRCKPRSAIAILLRDVGIVGYVHHEGTVAKATNNLYGLVKPDASTITVNDGVISAPAMTGATSSAAGAAGIVPAPTSADADKFLKGDGSWGEVSQNFEVVAALPESPVPGKIYFITGA